MSAKHKDSWLLVFLGVGVMAVSVLLSVAYLTLLERLVLALSQSRLSPSKSGFWGALQPLMDGLKLIQTRLLLPWKGELKSVLLLSFTSLGVMFFGFLLLNSSMSFMNSENSTLLLLIIFSILL